MVMLRGLDLQKDVGLSILQQLGYRLSGPNRRASERLSREYDFADNRASGSFERQPASSFATQSAHVHGPHSELYIKSCSDVLTLFPLGMILGDEQVRAISGHLQSALILGETAASMHRMRGNICNSMLAKYSTSVKKMLCAILYFF